MISRGQSRESCLTTAAEPCGMFDEGHLPESKVKGTKDRAGCRGKGDETGGKSLRRKKEAKAPRCNYSKRRPGKAGSRTSGVRQRALPKTVALI